MKGWLLPNEWYGVVMLQSSQVKSPIFCIRPLPLEAMHGALYLESINLHQLQRIENKTDNAAMLVIEEGYLLMHYYCDYYCDANGPCYN